jgi:hypothetical protein
MLSVPESDRLPEFIKVMPLEIVRVLPALIVRDEKLHECILLFHRPFKAIHDVWSDKIPEVAFASLLDIKKIENSIKAKSKKQSFLMSGK